jgi:hypothetical protein
MQASSTTLGYEPDAPTVVLSPHFDDAALGCWTLLGRRDLAVVVVVNVFAGIPDRGVVGDWDRGALLHRLDRRVLSRLGVGSARRDSAWLMNRRVAEDAEALESLGAKAVNLDFLDTQYRGLSESTHPDPAPAEIAAALVERVPRASGLVLPAALGAPAAGSPAHVDHVLARATVGVLGDFGGTVRFYADVPYALRLGWPEWVDRERGSADATAAWERSFEEGGIDTALLVPDVRTLGPDDRQRKRRALRAYQTQWPTLRHLDSELAFEVFWELGLQGSTGDPP